MWKRKKSFLALTAGVNVGKPFHSRQNYHYLDLVLSMILFSRISKSISSHKTVRRVFTEAGFHRSGFSPNALRGGFSPNALWGWWFTEYQGWFSHCFMEDSVNHHPSGFSPLPVHRIPLHQASNPSPPPSSVPFPPNLAYPAWKGLYWHPILT